MVFRKLCSIFWMRCNSGLSTTSALFLLRLPFGRPGFVFGPVWFGFLGLLFGLAGSFFFCCADHLFHTDRIRAPLLGADQGQREKGQPRNGFLQQAGEKVIQTVGFLACFGDHTLISCQQIGVLAIQQMLTKECPEYLRPGNDRVEETLHGSVAAAFLCPAR